MRSRTYSLAYSSGVRAASKSPGKHRQLNCPYVHESRREAWMQGVSDFNAGLVKINSDGSWSTIDE